jgi:hypothetical protein
MIERPIIAVRFHTPVTLGNQPHSEWFEARPGSSYLASGTIRPRPGNPDLGEQRTSVVFEIRFGGKEGDIDVEVPASNLAEIQRRAAEKPAQNGGTGGAK